MAPSSPPELSRRAALVIGLALVGSLGALPGEGGFAHAESIVTWLALWAAPAGVLAATGVRGWLAGLPPLLWVGLFFATGGELPTPILGAAACGALYAAGFTVGVLVPPPRAWAWAGGLFLAAGALAAAPSGGGVLTRPLSPGSTARLLDLSPVVWVHECAGGDAMRHPAVYERAGAGDLGPDRRLPYEGTPSALTALLVASIAVALASRACRRSSPA